MIPSLLLPGLIVGRWWLVPIAAVAWPVLLMVDGIGAGWRFGVSAGALAAANVAFAVAIHRGTASLLRHLAQFLHDPIGEAGRRAVRSAATASVAGSPGYPAPAEPASATDAQEQ